MPTLCTHTFPAVCVFSLDTVSADSEQNRTFRLVWYEEKYYNPFGAVVTKSFIQNPQDTIMTETEHLFQLVGQKLERLEQLYAWSGNQMQYIELEDMGAILEILAAKQRLLIEIEGIDRRIAEYRVDDPEDRVWPTQEMRAQCREKISQCDRLVHETLEHDRIATERLTGIKNNAKLQLQQFVDTAHVQGAYQQQKKTVRPRVDLGAG